jgi:uncharacterized protein DUF3467
VSKTTQEETRERPSQVVTDIPSQGMEVYANGAMTCATFSDIQIHFLEQKSKSVWVDGKAMLQQVIVERMTVVIPPEMAKPLISQLQQIVADYEREHSDLRTDKAASRLHLT